MNIEGFFGSKDTFGIEYQFNQKENLELMGYVRIWIYGDFIGTIKDYIFIESYLIQGLDVLLDCPNWDKTETLLNNKNKLFKYLHSNPNLDEETYLWIYYKVSLANRFGTLLDHLNIYRFLHNDKLYILWKVSKFYFEDVQTSNYTKNVILKRVDYSELKKFISEFKQFYKSITSII